MRILRGAHRELRTIWKIARVMVFFAVFSVVLALLGSLPHLGWLSDYAIHTGAILAVLLSTALEKRSLGFVGLSVDKRWARELLTGMLWGAASVVIVVLGMVWITNELSLDAFFAGAGIGAVGGSVLFYVLLALGEEVLFRGYLISVLRTRLGEAPSIMIAAGVFTLIHIINPDYYWFAFVYAFIIAILLGSVFVRRGTLWIVVGFHFTWDFLQSNVVFNVPARGGEVIFAIVLAANFIVARRLARNSRGSLTDLEQETP
jgi:membrane protease YdiL (CAAX protease family)